MAQVLDGRVGVFEALHDTGRRAASAELGDALVDDLTLAEVADMGKPVQWMTLQELRDELERKRPAWEAGLADRDGVLTAGQHPALGEDELLRRRSDR